MSSGVVRVEVRVRVQGLECRVKGSGLNLGFMIGVLGLGFRS